MSRNKAKGGSSLANLPADEVDSAVRTATISPKASAGGKSSASEGPMRVKTTEPDELLRHNISDEELSIMENSTSDASFNTYLTALGIAAGTLIPALRDIYGTLLSERSQPMDAFMLLNWALFFGSVTAAVISRRQAKATQLKVSGTAAAIRGRDRHRLSVVDTGEN